MRCNSDRTETAQAALEAASEHRVANSAIDEDSVTDLLTDLRHYCAEHGLDFAGCHAAADMNFHAEHPLPKNNPQPAFTVDTVNSDQEYFFVDVSRANRALTSIICIRIAGVAPRGFDSAAQTLCVSQHRPYTISCRILAAFGLSPPVTTAPCSVRRSTQNDHADRTQIPFIRMRIDNAFPSSASRVMRPRCQRGSLPSPPFHS